MPRAFMFCILLLGGCAPQARDILLSSVDLSNMETVQGIQDQLGPRDRVAFANYVVRHHFKSASYCGKPLLDAHGEAPETVGEAIDLAGRRDDAERRSSFRPQTPKASRELAKEEWDGLIRDRDLLIDAQDRLRLEYGNAADRRPEWKARETKIAAIDKKLVAMKSKVFGSGS